MTHRAPTTRSPVHAQVHTTARKRWVVPASAAAVLLFLSLLSPVGGTDTYSVSVMNDSESELLLYAFGGMDVYCDQTYATYTVGANNGPRCAAPQTRPTD
jgi:hypothetical protein